MLMRLQYTNNLSPWAWCIALRSMFPIHLPRKLRVSELMISLFRKYWMVVFKVMGVLYPMLGLVSTGEMKLFQMEQVVA
jgi:hypothetical protein